ncbi:MAG: NAD-dependent epimerase/dehydratase family protein [Candidatus Zixiibacteriota bacterium]
MKTILVTGGGGYIGSVLIPKLMENEYRVKCVDRFFFGHHIAKTNKQLEIIQEDTRKLTKDLFKEVDAVIDLAAISNDPAGEMFGSATWEINHQSRASTARLAKKMGVKRYILPSSCSIYGSNDSVVDETSETNPLTIYSKANEKAEQEIIPLADDNFTVVVIRQATVFGYSPRMRFDLAINGMTYGAWKTKHLPLMRDGTQYRPMVHVQDTTDVMLLLLEYDSESINGQIFNVGSKENIYQIKHLGEIIAEIVGKKIETTVNIEWYGDPDKRSYRVSFDKIENALNWKAKRNAEKGVIEIIEALREGRLEKTPETITLEWYKSLVEWHKIIKRVEKYGGILDI